MKVRRSLVNIANFVLTLVIISSILFLSLTPMIMVIIGAIVFQILLCKVDVNYDYTIPDTWPLFICRNVLILMLRSAADSLDSAPVKVFSDYTGAHVSSIL